MEAAASEAGPLFVTFYSYPALLRTVASALSVVCPPTRPAHPSTLFPVHFSLQLFHRTDSSPVVANHISSLRLPSCRLPPPPLQHSMLTHTHVQQHWTCRSQFEYFEGSGSHAIHSHQMKLGITIDRQTRPMPHRADRAAQTQQAPVSNLDACFPTSASLPCLKTHSAALKRAHCCPEAWQAPAQDSRTQPPARNSGRTTGQRVSHVRAEGRGGPSCAKGSAPPRGSARKL